MSEYLDKEMAKDDPLVINYAYSTFPLSIDPATGWTPTSTLVQDPYYRLFLVGISKTMLQTAKTKYLILADVSDQFSYETTDHGDPDIVQSLYDDAGNESISVEEPGEQYVPPNLLVGAASAETGLDTVFRDNNSTYTDYLDIILSQALSTPLAMDVETGVSQLVNVEISDEEDVDLVYLAKPRAMARKFPGFFFSSYEQTASFSTGLITHENYYTLQEEVYSVRDKLSTEEFAKDDELPADGKPYKSKLFVRLKDGISRDDREQVINALRNYVEDDFTSFVDLEDLLSTTDDSTEQLLTFFYIVATIATVLCFFILLVSFYSNVKENSWEYGVLRSLGLTRFQVVRVYVYEALILVVTSIFFGSTIGVLIAITLTLQFNLFSELPFEFDFPWGLFFMITSMALLLAVLGSYCPARRQGKKPISFVLKGL
eukprot:TRINITY_DN14551_c0_g1_i1.p1 TRINITY_DN14551_c0_g1~~TRINITY_DN14551_c0_g1_i1.p1  ORF type:complete len:444 (-),score=74.69 TRINITY_DN14551_c0_g1_i1:87-1376(-)